MLRRFIVIAAVFAVALILLAVQNKVLVGDQDLMAELRSVDGNERAFQISLRDIAGNPVDVSLEDHAEVTRRLAGNERLGALKVEQNEYTGNRILLTVPEGGADQAALRSRLTAKPYKRSNPPRSLFHLTRGIDLRGGVEFICRLNDRDGRVVAADDETVGILRARLDERGLTEPAVTKLSNGDIQVVIPGGTRADAARTRKVLESTGRLEFREVLDRFSNVRPSAPDSQVVALANGTYGPGSNVYLNRRAGEIIAAEEPNPDKPDEAWADGTPRTFYRLGPTRLVGSDVADAGETLHEGQLAVSITFTSTGAVKNEAFTREVKMRGDNNSGTGQLAILFDGIVKSAPRVIEPSGAQCVINGSFTKDEIANLNSALKGGSLVVTPEVISERVVGATLGEQTIAKALYAMAASFLAIVLFMWIYYGWILGSVANVALLGCGGLIWAVLSMFGATITLPGLAGLVLTIGMAVDTNILIFERIREELRENKGMRAAVEAGYERAFLTIIDANLTTFITAFILYWIGSGAVKGFGLTLMIGIVVNLFTGVYVGRMLTDWWTKGREAVTMRAWVPELKLPYISWRFIGYGFSLLTGVIGLSYFLFGHQFVQGRSFESNFDIDFTGGNMAQVIFKQSKTPEDIDAAIKRAYEALSPEQQRSAMISPKELRKQAYFAEIGGGGSTASREWVFRARDEEGGALEAERNVKERERGAVQRQLDAARSDEKPDMAKIKELEAKVAVMRQPIEDLSQRIAGRTDAFKQQIASAFGSDDLAVEGDEILAAAWSERILFLRLATVEKPSLAQLAGTEERMRRKPELEAVSVAAASEGNALEITATFRTRPQASRDAELSDPVGARLLALSRGEGLAPEQVAGLANEAMSVYNAAINAAAGQKLTIAKPFPSTEHFSGQVAGQMKIRALAAVLISLLAIMAYVAMRFEFRFGMGAVVSLFHDVLVTVGLLSILDIRIDLTVVAAILTLIGYSINDTIVTFDRIRENLKKKLGTLTEVIDLSIAQTMPRTFLTVSTVLITVVALLFWGGEALQPFTVTLLIGLLAGTYSSIFVAAPLLLTLGGTVVEDAPVVDPADATEPNGPAAVIEDGRKDA
jgi:SecD/SecF fusion protein